MAQQPTVVPLPRFVRTLGPLGTRLLALGIPMGPDTLMRVRGRTSGLPRTVAVAVLEFDGRRWVIGAYGEVNWVRNLRASGEAEVRIGRRWQRFRAVPLSAEEAAAFYPDVLLPFIERQRPPLRAFVRWLLRDVLADLPGAARTRPVFELHAQPGTDP
jgi:deazaflavin-dependent oxidoreductase (nitroreductase family)